MFKLTAIDQERITLFLLNGGGQPPYNNFHRLVKFCKSFDYNLVTVELPGHGQSPFKDYITAERMLDLFYRDFRGYANQFDRIALIGYSLGGLLGLKAAEKYPDLFEFVICLGAGIVIAPSQEAKMQYYTTREFFEQMRWLPTMIEYHERGWKELLESVHDMLFIGSEIFMNPESLADISFPIHLILGDQDEVADYKLQLELAEQYPSLSLEVIPDTKHFDYFVRSWPRLQSILGSILE